MVYEQKKFKLNIFPIEKRKYQIDYIIEKNNENPYNCKELDNIKNKLYLRLNNFFANNFLINIDYKYNEIKIIFKDNNVLIKNNKKINTIISNTLFLEKNYSINNIEVYYDFWNVW